MKEFRSFGQFAEHLALLAAESELVTHHIVESAAKEIEATAKGIVGEYQKAIGPFPAWEELADSTQAQRARLGYSENDPGYRSGEMRESIGCTARGSEAAVGSNDQNLVWFELGTTKQPPRPVLGPAAMHSRERVKTMIGKTTFAWLAGRSWLKPRINA